MEITIESLLNGKPTIIKEKEYLATKDYVTPFLNAMKPFTDQFIVNVEIPKQITTTNNNKDITYNKVSIQAVMPSKYDVGDLQEVFGFVYVLDVRTPVYKIYRAWMDSDTNALFVMHKEDIITVELDAQTIPEVDIKSLMEKPSAALTKLNNLNSKWVGSSNTDCQSFLGNLIELSLLTEYNDLGGKVKISSADVVKAFEEIYHITTSKFYVGELKECSYYNFYKALAYQIAKGKDIVNRWEKSFLISSFLKVF